MHPKHEADEDDHHHPCVNHHPPSHVWKQRWDYERLNQTKWFVFCDEGRGGQLKWRISKDENRTVVCLTSQPHKPSTTGPSLEAVQQVASSPVLLMSENLEHFIQVFVKIKTFTYAEILADKSKELSCFGNIWQGGSIFGRDLNLVILNGILRKVLD